MPIYSAQVSDVVFLLRHVLHWDHYSNLPSFGDADLDTVESILGEAARLCENALAPLNRSGDEEGCRRAADGRVTTPNGFRDAFRTYREGGWLGLAAPVQWGGQGLPYTLAAIINEFCAAANMAFTMYPGLTQTAIAALERHASDEVKQRFLPRMVAGEWCGTMNLTEPHCGTDLGLIKTRARRDEDGAFSITGQKIFISAGEHDLTENIVHLVLARIEDAPAGTKGLSLFVVPKRLVREDGSPGAANSVRCGAIERKMGIHANATCVMDYEAARGWLVGEENRGLQAMFTMMNEARLGVAGQGLAISNVAYQNAAAYAKERLQGRALSGPAAPDQPADPIIVHPDVRRLLLTVRSFNDAARALLIYASLQADVTRSGPDASSRATAEARLGLLTPILKAVLTDIGFDNAVRAQQVFGGYGYVAESGVEQFVRDARITMIYEGANAIQALDLVGRKLPRDGGRALQALFAEMTEDAERAARDPSVAPLASALRSSMAEAGRAVTWLMQNALADPDKGAAAAYDVTHLFGLVLLGWMSVRIAAAAQGLLADAGQGPEADALAGKVGAARFFCEQILPETSLRLRRIEAGSDALRGLAAHQF